DCKTKVALPPFRFYYKNEKVSPLRLGEDFYGTIISSSNPQDEWGMWNKYATADNHKVRQDFADYGATSWSMDKVIDPAGGVLEVAYERDTYKGESYADDTKDYPVSWRKCDATNGKDANHLCIDILPRRWEAACNKNHMLQGEYTFRPTAPWTDADYAYIGKMYKSPGVADTDKEIYFQLDGNYQFKVGCGASLLGWKANSCNRHRSVGMIGSGRIKSITVSNNIVVPFLDKDPNATAPNSIAAEVRTIELDVPYYLVDRTMKRAGEALTDRNNRTTVYPIKGMVWIKNVDATLRGGDLRVSRLIRRDIGGLVQTTKYAYAVGQMAQYPDSVLSTAFAERFSPLKSIVVMPSTFLPSISRIPGVDDDETAFLPAPVVTYPKVTVTNISEDQTQILNGKTEYEFITPESGIPMRAGAPAPFMKVILSLDREDETVAYGSIKIQLLNAAKANVGTELIMDQLTGTRKNIFIKEVSDPTAAFTAAQSVRLTYTLGSTVVFKDVAFKDETGPTNLQNYSEVKITTYFNSKAIPATLDAGLSDMKKCDFTPLLVRTTKFGEPVNTTYADFSGFLGRAKSTNYYRWNPGNPDVQNKVSDPTAAAKYKLIRQDSIIYTAVATSGDDRFLGTAKMDPLKIGKDEEKWEYTRKIHCNEATAFNSTGFPDNCSFATGSSAYASYKNLEVTPVSGAVWTPKQMAYVRYPAFVSETITKTGFNGSQGPSDYMVNRARNFRFDPITGTPTLSVGYTGPSNQDPSKATRSTPAYHVNTALARTMFERNMLNQVFREDAYTWDKATRSGVNQDGAVLNFDTDNLTDPNILPPRLTRVKLNPFSQGYLDKTKVTGTPRPLALRDNPILGMGDFKPRFNLLDANGISQLSNNAALFTPSFTDGSFLKKFDGVQIDSINDFLKPLQKRNVYGQFTASRYEPGGFHQIGIFGNAWYGETAVLTAEGRQGNFPDVSRADGWRFTGGTPTLDGNFVRLTDGFTLSHNLNLKTGGTYLVEAQLHSTAAHTCQVSFFTDAGGVGDAQTLAVIPGLNTYQLTLKASVYTTLPTKDVNRVKLVCTEAGAYRIAYIRAYPGSAETLTYLYDARGNMVQSVNEQNVSSYYEYDLFGNLASIRNDDGVLFTAHKRELVNVNAP
ncbi:MAG: hypothetical protein M3Y08_17175, partial [Fibrobacterota bacterium]|nr:hypothetical protein [Fibrobacterota bacterium]